ncbi:MAG: glycosyltransferase family 39 protein [Verrucomicrobia bacterium]|nr:glycosyltransferase family 39 protein [Verrucomicrobiota bacterium]
MLTAQNSPSWRRDLLVLVLVFAVLFGFRLGSYPLSNPDEGRYAEIPREMVATGDWVTPRLNGVNYFEKPPLMYWATAACLKVFGPSEWSMRAMPALFGLGGVLLAYAAGRRLHSREAGLASAAVLGTSLLWFALGRIMLLDMAVSALMSAALFCFILGVREPAGSRRRWLFYGLYAAMALATLTKGLIGFMVTGAVMFLWLLVFNQWKRLLPLYLPTGSLLFLAIAAPWHVLAALHNETWVHRYFYYEHWQRFTSPVADRPGAWWYFIPIVLLGLFPWTGFLWTALRDNLRGGWAARKENADAWFLVTWAVFIFLFFTKSNSKLVPYILPVFPPLAVLIGISIANALKKGAAASAELKIGLRAFSFICGILGVALIVVVLRSDVIKDPQQLLALRPFAFIMAAMLLAGGVMAPWLARNRGAGAALAAVIYTMALFLGVLTFAAPHIQKPGTKELAAIVTARAQPGDRVLHYHEFFHDFTFYAHRLVDVVDFKGELELEEDAAARASGRFMDEATFRRLWTGPGRVWAVARIKDVDPASKSGGAKLFADPTFRYHLIAASRDHYLFSNQP